MLRAIVCTSTVLAIGLSVTACDTTATTPQAQPSADAPAPSRPDQSGVYFPATVDTYGLNPAPVDREHLAELHALRQIDPCGFVDQHALAATGHPDFSYTHTSVPWIEPGGNSPIAPLGGQGCTTTFGSPNNGVALQVLPGEPRWNDTQFIPAPQHPGTTKHQALPCTFRVTLPLTSLAGAPKSMRDPVLEVAPVNGPDSTNNPEQTSACQITQATADAAATHVEHTGIPVLDEDSPAARFLSGDPCAAAADLPTAGFVWKEPNPTAQWPTTWRHPGVCNLQLNETDSAPATAVIKHGLVHWSDDILKMPWGADPQRSEQDGVEVFTFTSYPSPGCLVIAKANHDIEPLQIGTAAPDLAPSTPVVTARLNGTIRENCADTAQRVTLNALKRVI